MLMFLFGPLSTFPSPFTPGDLDIHEWVRLFATINHNIPAQEARMIFMKVDRDADGFISMKDLIPVVFNKVKFLFFLCSFSLFYADVEVTLYRDSSQQTDSLTS